MYSKQTIDRQFSSAAFDTRVRFLVIHDTQEDLITSLRTLSGKNPDHVVSAHYLVSDHIEQGYPSWVYQLVDEDKRAWHAGFSEWRGETQLNSASIGIEIVNLDGNKHPFNEHQVEAVIALAQAIIKRHTINPTDIVGHSDIAPNRKIDPGRLFPWKRLYEAGIGAWPNEDDVKAFMKKSPRETTTPDAITLQKALRHYGYAIELTGRFDEQTQTIITAFQRHFRPKNIDGYIDPESWAILQALIKKYFPPLQ